MKRNRTGYPRTPQTSSRLWLAGGAAAAVSAIAGALFATSSDDRGAGAASDSQRAGVAYVAWDGERANTASFAGKPWS